MHDPHIFTFYNFSNSFISAVPYFAYSTERVSRITVTRIWPG